MSERDDLARYEDERTRQLAAAAESARRRDAAALQHAARLTPQRVTMSAGEWMKAGFFAGFGLWLSGLVIAAVLMAVVVIVRLILGVPPF